MLVLGVLVGIDPGRPKVTFGQFWQYEDLAFALVPFAVVQSLRPPAIHIHRNQTETNIDSPKFSKEDGNGTYGRPTPHSLRFPWTSNLAAGQPVKFKIPGKSPLDIGHIQNLVQGRPFPDILMALFGHCKFYLLIHPASWLWLTNT